MNCLKTLSTLLAGGLMFAGASNALAQVTIDIPDIFIPVAGSGPTTGSITFSLTGVLATDTIESMDIDFIVSPDANFTFTAITNEFTYGDLDLIANFSDYGGGAYYTGGVSGGIPATIANGPLFTVDFSVSDGVTGTFNIDFDAFFPPAIELTGGGVFEPLLSPGSITILAATPDIDPVTTSVNFTDRLVGSAASQSVTLNEVGGALAPFTLTDSGDASSSGGTSPILPNDSTSITVTLDTSTAGAKSGSVTVNDGDADSDVINVSGDVFDPSNASFSASADLNTLDINFGTFVQNSGVISLSPLIANLLNTADFTVGLDLDTIFGSGDTAVLTTNLSNSEFANLLAGSSYLFDVFFDTSFGANTYLASYTINLSDIAIFGGGAPGSQTLTLNLSGTIIAPGIPEPMSGVMLLAGLASMVRRRKA